MGAESRAGDSDRRRLESVLWTHSQLPLRPCFKFEREGIAGGACAAVSSLRHHLPRPAISGHAAGAAPHGR